MKEQAYFNRQITKLFDNLQEQVDTLAVEIEELKKEKTFEEYDKQLDKILEDKEWDSYFEEGVINNMRKFLHWLYWYKILGHTSEDCDCYY